MDNQPSFDRSLLIPIGVAIFSLLGICAILVSGRLNQQPAVVEEVPTSTAFQYAFIGTEPAFSTVTPGLTTEEVLTEPPTGIETPELPLPATPTTASANTAIVFPTITQSGLITLLPLTSTGVPSRTPTSAFAAPFGAGTFDDVDNRFVYSGDWDPKTSVSGATGNTLHVSSTLGNSIKFLFIGNELRVFFQAGPSLGTIRLTLDNTSYVMNEASTSTQNYEWVLASATTGTHTVTIAHDSGGSINFDAIIVPVVPTTPTNTATTNP